MNITAIGSAISTLFAALTPPTGQAALQEVSSKRQLGLGKLPAVIVSWTNTRDITIGFGERRGVIDYTATLYLPKVSAEADDTALQAWHDVVIDVLLTQLQLNQWGSPNGVLGAEMRSVTPGEEQLGESYYAALECAIEVEFWHPVTVSA